MKMIAQFSRKSARKNIAVRALSTPAPSAAADPALIKVTITFSSSFLYDYFLLRFNYLYLIIHHINFFYINIKVYGGLKDQDRIFTNLYGEGVSSYTHMHIQIQTYSYIHV